MSLESLNESLGDLFEAKKKAIKKAGKNTGKKAVKKAASAVEKPKKKPKKKPTYVTDVDKEQLKGVDKEYIRRREQGWTHNPWHDKFGQFTTRSAAASFSTGTDPDPEHPKYADDLGTKTKPKPGKKVAKVCGRHARHDGRDIRCHDGAVIS